MILRRVIAHFRKQEWTAIAIDFVIVVVGVFIGIQVSNWNEVRRDHAREDVYLGSLAKDIRGDIAEIEEIIRVSTLRLSAMKYLIETASGDDLPRTLASARGDIALATAAAAQLHRRRQRPGSASAALVVLVARLRSTAPAPPAKRSAAMGVSGMAARNAWCSRVSGAALPSWLISSATSPAHAGPSHW